MLRLLDLDPDAVFVVDADDGRIEYANSGAAATVAEAARVLGHQPTLSVEGPVDGLPRTVTSQLFPALREALSNVACHAAATATWVDVSVSGERLRRVVEDDGAGPGARTLSGTGLHNLAERAAAVGGASSLSAGAPGCRPPRVVGRRARL